MKSDRIIIAISGDKGADKDTIASMIEYVMSVGITKANFREWYNRHNVLEDLGKNVIHFADQLKEVCSLITGLHVHYFNKAEYKDLLWWIYGSEGFFIGEDVLNGTVEVDEKKSYYKIELKNLTLAEELRNARREKKIPIIKLRTILQYVGTEMFKEMFDDRYWINNTIVKARKIVNETDFCIIPDLRFEDELYALRKACNYSDYRCIIVNVGETDEFKRRTNERGLHRSDKQLKEFDYYISNKKESYFKLFNEVLKFCQTKILK